MVEVHSKPTDCRDMRSVVDDLLSQFNRCGPHNISDFTKEEMENQKQVAMILNTYREMKESEKSEGGLSYHAFYAVDSSIRMSFSDADVTETVSILIESLSRLCVPDEIRDFWSKFYRYLLIAKEPYEVA